MKMLFLPYFATGMLLLSGSGEAIAENQCHAEKALTLPITFNVFTPTVPVFINGHQVNMGIDTGADISVITPETVEQMHLPQDPHHFTNAMGTGGLNRVNNVYIDTLEFGGTEYSKKSLPIISFSQQITPSEAKVFGPASPMAGLIGTDILSNYDIEYDAPARTLTLYKVSHCASIKPSWQGQYVKMPITITPSNRFALPVIVDGHKTTAVFDSGSSGERFASSAMADVGLTPEMLEHDPTGDGYGVNGRAYKTHFHHFASVIIGRELFHNVGMDIAAIPTKEANMLIGEDYMRTHRFLLSYATHMLFIQKAHPK